MDIFGKTSIKKLKADIFLKRIKLIEMSIF